jgi:Leucine Rich repeats (2 copies)
MLYLQQNCISEISGLQQLKSLKVLNLAQNMIDELQTGAFDGVTLSLESLDLSRNMIADTTSFSQLQYCTNLHTLDLSNNKIDGKMMKFLLSVLSNLPSLRFLCLVGNPCTNMIDSYRKTVINSLPHLQYFDDAPVSEEERIIAQAWALGGALAEKEAREKILTQKKHKLKSQSQRYREWQASIRLNKSLLSPE